MGLVVLKVPGDDLERSVIPHRRDLFALGMLY